MEATLTPQNWLDHTLEQATPWIAHCLENHSKCLPASQKKVPTRLIDVGPQDGSRNPFLIEPPSPSFTPAELERSWPPKSNVHFIYLALSYCWGEKGNILTTLENIEERKKGIPWEDIPQTIRESILVTRKLGFKYLWVDSLCIIQGPDGDWVTESSQMADVYGGAFLTIAAALSPDVEHGLHQSISFPTQLMTDEILVNPQFSILKNPLYRRGWAFQERLLARRILIFGEVGLYWECQDSYSPEYPKIPGRKQFRLSESLPIKSLNTSWHFAISDYSARSLRLESDKLPALSGVASLYHQYTKHDYLAGIWRQSLLADLLWKKQANLLVPFVGPRVPVSYRAPSWSWASIDVNLEYLITGHLDHVLKPSTTVIEARVDLKTSLAPFGEVIGGLLILLTPLLPASSIKEALILGQFVGIWMDGRTTTDKKEYLPEEESDGEELIWCALIGINREDYGCGLVLRKGWSAGCSCFERIGYFNFKTRPASRAEGAIKDFHLLDRFLDNKETITII